MHCLYWKMFPFFELDKCRVYCRIYSVGLFPWVKEFHTVTSRGTDKGKVVFFGRGPATALDGRDRTAAGPVFRRGLPCDRHICRDTSTGINHAFLVNIMAQGITDGLIQSIMTQYLH